MTVEYYQRLLRSVFEGRKVILATGTIVGMARRLESLQKLGVEECFLVGKSMGTGDLPEDLEVPWKVIVEEKAPDMLTGIRNYNQALENPSSELVDALHRFDPDGEAIVLNAHVSDVMELAGRPRLGARQPRWAALEDKVVIDAFWDRAGVKRASSVVVEAGDFEESRRVSELLDEGSGTAWAGDTRQGFNGGAVYVRRVANKEDARRAHEFFKESCHKVRIMPFLEGIPCSIHGVVFPQKVIAFRPVEMVVFRRRDSPELLYSGFSTWWDPREEDREYMRQVAKKVGALLREEVGYRGAFTIDGVMTPTGFIPTELNARTGGAFRTLVHGEPEMPLELLEVCIREGLPLDYRPEELEEFVLNIADTDRTGGGWTVVKTVFEKTQKYQLHLTESGSFRLEEQGAEEGVGTLSVGPSSVGGFLNFQPAKSQMTAGSSIAPMVARVWALADREFQTEFGELIPAVVGDPHGC